MKNLRKWIGILLVVTLMFSLAACTTADDATDDTPDETEGTESTEENGDTPEETPDVVVEPRTGGINIFTSGAYALLVLKNNSEIVFQANGDETMILDNAQDIEKIITDLESMIENGVDGIVFWSPVPSQYGILSERSEEAQVPFEIGRAHV